MEYSIVDLAEVISTPNFRLDAEFYRELYVKSEKLVYSKKNNSLGSLISILTDYHANGSYKKLRENVQMSDSPNYALMIRAVNFERNDFKDELKYISEHSYNFLKKTKVFGGEIIINKIGNAGAVYLVPPLNTKISLGMNQFMICTKDNVNNYFLYVFLICKHGRLLVERRITGTVPLSIDKKSVRSIPVPMLEKKFQSVIKKLVEQHFFLKNQFRKCYTQAEQLLLSELDLLDWQPTHQLTFIKNFSDTVQAGCIDAEYFQPQYEEIIDAIKKYKGGFDRLGNLVSIEKGTEPGSKAYVDNALLTPFVRVSNLTRLGFLKNNQQYISKQLYEKLKKYQPKQGEILLSKDGTPGIAYYLDRKVPEMIISSGILRLKLHKQKVFPCYLTLLLNSPVVQKQIEQSAGGSIINHWRPDQVESTIVPILDIRKQKEIEKLVVDSQKANKDSRALLEIAKRGVELAIEKDEKEAEKWINLEIEKLSLIAPIVPYSHTGA